MMAERRNCAEQVAGNQAIATSLLYRLFEPISTHGLMDLFLLIDVHETMVSKLLPQPARTLELLNAKRSHLIWQNASRNVFE